MNKKQISQLEMLDATISYLDTHASIWNTIPILGKYKNDLVEIVDKIKENPEALESAVRVSKSLREIKRNLSIKMDILDDTLEAYADDIGSEELRLKAANTKSDYFRLTNDEFGDKVKNMIALLQKNVVNMVGYGMTNEQIADAMQEFNSFEEARGKTILSTSDKSNHNQLGRVI